MIAPTLFNIRVYGILINEMNQVLVTDEFIKGNEITKFPGGGLQLGEGTIEGLKREFMEEANMEIDILNHYYTTDYFQVSVFNPSHQIISIYYRIKSIEKITLPIKKIPFDFDERINNAQVFRWIDLKSISKNDFTLPIDKRVGEMLRMA